MSKKWRNMSILDPFGKSLTCVRKHLKTGLCEAKLIIEQFRTKVEKHGCMILIQSGIIFRPQLEKSAQKWPTTQLLSMLELAVPNKKKISNDRLVYSQRRIQMEKWLAMSPQDSVTHDMGSPSWWNESAVEKSREWWLPTETDCSDSDTNFSKKCVKSMRVPSWFTATVTNYPISTATKILKSFKKISCPSLTSSLPAGTENGPALSNVKGTSLKKKHPNSLIKVRVYPSTHQKILLNKLFSCHRRVYNKIISESSDDIFSLDKFQFSDKYRSIVKKNTAHNHFDNWERWSDIPEECLDSAFRDVIKAVKTTMSLSKAQKIKTGRGFRCTFLKPKMVRDRSNSIEIRSRTITKLKGGIRFFCKYFGLKKNECFKTKSKVPELITSCRLQRLKTGKYYLCIPRVADTFVNDSQDRICALDPGIRKFLTGYDLNGNTFKLSENHEYIYRRQRQIDRLKSRLRNFKGKRNARYRLKKNLDCLNIKLSNIVKDCHHKISKWLVTNYDQVLLPTFETSKMMCKNNRVINRTTTRNMSIMSHYQFKNTLLDKASRFGTKVHICTEEFTSKTCTSCGFINKKLGGARIFNCFKCKFVVDRDINGARNILIKNHHLVW